MNKISFLIRKITIPPVFAAALLIISFLFRQDYIGAWWYLLIGLLTLTVFPTLAYPLQRFIPGFRDKGRNGQRSLAMVFSFLGYLTGTVLAFSLKAPRELKFIFLEYLLCGIAMLLLNKVFKLKASGHACGIVGPVLLCLYFQMWIPAAVGALLVTPVYISSLKTKRHTAGQLIGGSLIPAFVLGILALLFWLI